MTKNPAKYAFLLALVLVFSASTSIAQPPQGSQTHSRQQQRDHSSITAGPQQQFQVGKQDRSQTQSQTQSQNQDQIQDQTQYGTGQGQGKQNHRSGPANGNTGQRKGKKG